VSLDFLRKEYFETIMWVKYLFLLDEVQLEQSSCLKAQMNTGLMPHFIVNTMTQVPTL